MMFALVMLISQLSAAADLTIEINRGNDDPLPIAIVPFSWQAGFTVPEDIARIVERDLHRSGQFAPIPREDMISRPDSSREVYYGDWKSLGVDYILVGKLGLNGSNGLSASYELMDVNTQRVIFTATDIASFSKARYLAHTISDRIYEKLTNIRGAFRTELLYVSSTRDTDKPRFRLIKSDIDGANEVVLLDQNQPIMSPTWSPEGKRIAYVSFETTRPAIYLHNLETGQREQLTNYPGLNGSPTFSPDGRKLAMVLSKDGSPDIYVMDLASRQLDRLTDHFAIDTEPAWLGDGKSIVFTSDRGGKPQIYSVALDGQQLQRLTFEGDYNARARVLPDDLGLILVHRNQGDYHIAIYDTKRRKMEVLTTTSLDESPSVAPNATMLLYATSYRGKGILAAVSVDGGVTYRLPSQYGDVREPAWSPFLD
ncbi:Tol-Pal system protein TolB [Spongiibacter sp. KMU-158]|uniref:Tol-Pal system protein TolB n=2 Tax=Spongiibacter pelagi TaxID=2760804 RepID=A0A927GXV3_9GAMM|nr:Tol-Pal system protein TolB [Spongiibacter pelagi]